MVIKIIKLLGKNQSSISLDFLLSMLLLLSAENVADKKYQVITRIQYFEKYFFLVE